MKEKHFQTQPVRERRSAFGSNTSPDSDTEPGHDARPHAPLNASPESAPVPASDRGLDGGLARDPGSGTGFAHDAKTAEQDKPGPGSPDAFDPTRRQLYAEALKACHLEKRRGFQKFVRGANPERDATPAIRPVPDDQRQSLGRCSRHPSCGRRPPKANAARLLDYLQGDSWQSDAPGSLELGNKALERLSKPEGEVIPKAHADKLAPSEPDRAPQWQTAPSLNFESLLKEEAPRVARPLGRKLQTPALLNFELLIEAKAGGNTPEAETEAEAEAETQAKEQAPELSESARKSALQPSALSRDCEPRGDGSDAPKRCPVPEQGRTTRGKDRHPRGLAPFFALCKRLARTFL